MQNALGQANYSHAVVDAAWPEACLRHLESPA